LSTFFLEYVEPRSTFRVWVDIKTCQQRCCALIHSVSLQYLLIGENFNWNDFRVRKSGGFKLSQALRLLLQSHLLDEPLTGWLRTGLFCTRE
jgi:hypothetical protein